MRKNVEYTIPLIMKRILSRTQKKLFSKEDANLPETEHQVMKPQEPGEQSLDIYWTPEMAAVLETWGEGNAWHELRFLMAGLHGKVLDIACGTGKNIEDLQQFSMLNVCGCDISDYLIEKTIERGIQKENLKVYDATNMGYSDNFFDHAYSIGSLEHFTETGILEAISEVYRITKQCSFHQVPTSRSGIDEGWITPYQSYYNNSTDWWLKKFKASYSNVLVLNSLWEDQRSLGKWFVCTKSEK